jgi:hypothetical protein
MLQDTMTEQMYETEVAYREEVQKKAEIFWTKEMEVLNCIDGLTELSQTYGKGSPQFRKQYDLFGDKYKELLNAHQRVCEVS